MLNWNVNILIPSIRKDISKILLKSPMVNFSKLEFKREFKTTEGPRSYNDLSYDFFYFMVV